VDHYNGLLEKKNTEKTTEVLGIELMNENKKMITIYISQSGQCDAFVIHLCSTLDKVSETYIILLG
jgi:hypothetical protein